MFMHPDDLLDKITKYLLKHDIKKIALFGSYLRGEEQSDSDIDIIVEFERRKSLLDLVSIELELSEKLGIKVDLLTENSISPYMIDSIKSQMRVIYP